MAEYTIVAESPGDILITFTGASGQAQIIPLKSITAQKSTDVEKQYGTGYHGTYAHVQGKIAYEGDFEIGSWWVSSAENPSTWMDLIKNELTWNGVQGLSREFQLIVADTGTEYKRSQRSGPITIDGNSTIVTFDRCLLKGDSLNIGDVGSTVATKYPWTAMSRNPP